MLPPTLTARLTDLLGAPLRTTPVSGGSINQAYTRLSERYEPRRKSHAGNVFQQVLFETTPGGHVRPLDDLRLKAVIKSGKKLKS